MDLEIQKISNKKISELVADQLQEWIETGKVQPGEKLPSVRELCDLFNVGRTAIRDAITTLKGKGLVDVRRGEGTYVKSYDYSRIFDEILLLNQTDIHKLFNVRKILEAGIAEMAAQARDPEDIHRIRTHMDQIKEAKTIEGWKADYEFHLAIAEATKNEVLVLLLETISSTMKIAIKGCHQIIMENPQLTREIVVQHENIYSAIKEGRPSEARASVIEHLTYVESLLNRLQTK